MKNYLVVLLCLWPTMATANSIEILFGGALPTQNNLQGSVDVTITNKANSSDIESVSFSNVFNPPIPFAFDSGAIPILAGSTITSATLTLFLDLNFFGWDMPQILSFLPVQEVCGGSLCDVEPSNFDTEFERCCQLVGLEQMGSGAIVVSTPAVASSVGMFEFDFDLLGLGLGPALQAGNGVRFSGYSMFDDTSFQPFCCEPGFNSVTHLSVKANQGERAAEATLDIAYTSAPEPSTIIFGLLGVASLFCLRRSHPTAS